MNKLLSFMLAGICALLLVPACSGGDKEQMLHQLEELERMNRAYEPMTNDTLAQQLVDYFDRHGTSNERMRAHYVLGCTYRDMGESPRAVASYQDAIDRADTTDANCDFRTLSCVYSQLAMVLHRQLLLSDEIVARRRSTHFAEKAGDMQIAIGEKKLSAAAYILLNKRDTAETIIKDAIQLYLKHGYEQKALQTTTMLMFLYIDEPDSLDALKSLIDQFDNKFALFDEHHELPSTKRKFYYYKGKYFERVGLLDSAEYYYRKVYHPDMLLTAQNSMYKGLLGVFQKRDIADSVFKYAQLYCAVNDSSIALNDQERIAQMTASYNYENYQRQAIFNMEKARDRLLVAIVFMVLAVIGVFTALFFWRRYLVAQQTKRQEIESLKKSHADALLGYEKKLQQLQQLESAHKRTIATIQEEMDKAKETNNSLLSARAEAQNIITSLTRQHEESKHELSDEIKEYKDRLEMLEHQLELAGYKEKSIPFLSMGIVKRVKLFAKDGRTQLSDHDLQQLTEAVSDYYPDLVSDLKAASNISDLGIRVCLLVVLNLKSSEIVHLLNISSQQVGNLKKDINTTLFNDATAVTLFKNLSSRYKIFCS